MPSLINFRSPYELHKESLRKRCIGEIKRAPKGEQERLMKMAGLTRDEVWPGEGERDE